MTTTVPLVDLGAQHREVDAAVQEDLARVFATTAFINGPDVAAFEQEYAEFVGVRHCVGVANGTDAVEMALRATGVGDGDEVLVPANTFIATAEAVRRAGARPVFVDVDDVTMLMDPELVGAAMTSRTRAVLPVHLYGQVADVKAIAEVSGHVPVIEDAAQSQGATRQGSVSGSLGLAAATSFYPGKNLGAAGDAGAVTTDDDDVAHRLRLLVNHGSQHKYVHETLGFNSRLDTVQAVVLRHKLRRLETWNAARRTAAARYDAMLADVAGVRVPRSDSANVHVWHLYVVRVAERDRVLAELNAAGIGAGLHYPVPVHLTDPFSTPGAGRGTFPVSEKACDEIISLPMFPHLTVQQQEQVVEALVAAVAG